MCTFVMLHAIHPLYPWIVAANRDESFSRPSSPPQLLRQNPAAVGGRDLLAGGTWLGINSEGLLSAITNRRAAPGPSPSARSRGLLVMDALGLSTAASAADMAANVAPSFNPFSLVCADREACYVVTWDGAEAKTARMPPGPVLLAHGNPDQWQLVPRLASAAQALQPLARATADEIADSLKSLCRQHLPADGPFCLHSAAHGTVSSTILILAPNLGGRYLYAPGPPCVTPYQDVSDLLSQIRGRPLSP